MNIPAIDRTEVPAALRLAVECAIEEAEELGDIPQRLHAQLRDSGAFRLLTPREYGGVEMPLTEALELYEKFGHIDASTGLLVWNANFGFMAALLDEAAAQTMWADDREPVFANSASPGMAERVRGGFRLSGRWEIVTGINHADWFVGIGAVHHCDGPATSAAEAPEVRVFVVPRSQFVVEDTWNTTGTRGSGSNAVVVTNASIPFDMTFTIDQPARIDRPLYRGFIPALVLPGVAAVVLGTARRVIEETAALVADKKALTGAALAESARTQYNVAKSRTAVAAAKLLLFSAADSLERSAEANAPVSIQQRAELRAAMAYAAEVSREAIVSMYQLASSTVLYRANLVERLFRDGMAALQHANLSTQLMEAAGRVWLGQEPGIGLF